MKEDHKEPKKNRPFRVSDRHAAVRRANRTETAEDYVEAIDDLVNEHEEARVKDLVECFGVSHVTVSRTLQRLQRDGLVSTQPYRSIELTEKGRDMAKASRKRHATVLRFLLFIGVPQKEAELDAEGIEHHVGPETLAAFEVRIADVPKGKPEGPSEPSDPGRFQRVRDAHASELTEDYVEAVGDLITDRGEARVTDLAHFFGVSHVTVSRNIGRIQRDGFVETEPYRPIRLTPKGSALAAAARHRHAIVLSFLLSLGVSPRSAEIDAEGVEHHVSPATLEIFERLSEADPGSPT